MQRAAGRASLVSFNHVGLSHEDAQQAARGAMLEVLEGAETPAPPPPAQAQDAHSPAASAGATEAAAGQPPAQAPGPDAQELRAAGAAGNAPPAPPATPAPRMRRRVHARRARWTREATEQFIADLKMWGKGQCRAILNAHGDGRTDGQPSLYPVRFVPRHNASGCRGARQNCGCVSQ